MGQIIKYTRLFMIIGVLGSILGYAFLLYKGYTLNDEINERKKEIVQLEAERVRRIRELTLTENTILHIAAKSKDSATVQQGKKLAIGLGIPVEKHFEVTAPKDTSPAKAEAYEQSGYEALLNKDVNTAITAFINSENAYNGYHQVYEITKYLVRNKESLSDRNSAYWQTAYQNIVSHYSWRMPKEFKAKLQAQIK